METGIRSVGKAAAPVYQLFKLLATCITMCGGGSIVMCLRSAVAIVVPVLLWLPVDTHSWTSMCMRGTDTIPALHAGA